MVMIIFQYCFALLVAVSVISWIFNAKRYVRNTNRPKRCHHNPSSRRRRTYIRVPQTDLGYLGFLLSARRQDFGQFWDFRKFFEFFLAENRCESIDSEATIGPVVAPWIVWKTLKKKVRVRSGLVGQN